MKTVWIVFGTRPEVIKMAPVISAFRDRPGEVMIREVYTGQHRELATDLFDTLDVRPDHSLDLMRHDQTPADVGARALGAMDGLLSRDRPDCVLVQGDTGTAFFTALAAFFHRLPVGHVEAGLRSFRRYEPYPEEMMRRLADRVSAMHFAPTPGAVQNLRSEGIHGAGVFLTGNPVIDAVRRFSLVSEARASRFARTWAAEKGPFVLVTLHRRESFGASLRRMLGALAAFARSRPDVRLLYPVHPNPAVTQAAREILADIPSVTLHEPLGYLDLLYLLRRAGAVLTDSGGLQEEASALGRTILVARDVTERPEGVEAGWATLVGCDPELIAVGLAEELDDGRRPVELPDGETPYGDGRAGERIADIVIHQLTGAVRRTTDWEPCGLSPIRATGGVVGGGS